MPRTGELGIAIVVDFLPDDGGTSAMAQGLALELRRRGHLVTLVSRWPVDRRGRLAQEARQAGIAVVTPKWVGRAVDDRLWPGTYNLRRLETALRIGWRLRTVPTRARLAAEPAALTARQELVHRIIVRRLARSAITRAFVVPPVVHVICRTTVPLIAPLRRLGWPIVYTETGELHADWFDPALLEPLGADVYVADSFAGSRRLAESVDCAVEVVPSLGGFDEPTSPLPDVVRRLTVVSRLVPVKRLDVAVRAVARMDDVSLDVHGGGPEEAALRDLVRELRVEGRVRFHGHADRAGVRHALDDGHAFVVCSESEGTPTSVLEAMSRGRPLVTTPVGGVPELVEDGQEALFFDGSVDGLVAAVDRLRTEPGLAGRLGDAARVRWERDFRPGAIVDRYERIYRDAIATAAAQQ